jgi:hypothetical protein
MRAGQMLALRMVRTKAYENLFLQKSRKAEEMEKKRVKGKLRKGACELRSVSLWAKK